VSEMFRLAYLDDDEEIWPRHGIDQSWVSRLADAIEAGAKLPPIVADLKTKKITDGWHRVAAWKKVLGEAAEAEVEFVDYSDETAMLKDAVARNATHGRMLERQDQVRAALKLEERNVSQREIAVVLNVPEQAVHKMLIKVVLVEDLATGRVVKRAAKPIAYPRPNQDPRVLTPRQYDVMRSSGGYRTSQVLTQLSEELESGLVDLEIPGLNDRYWRLHDLIEQLVPAADVVFPVNG